tara:strand:- start:854 stop:1741 length:888 start_codon:yes stop_codon:yes gene_type:complete
MKLYVIVNPHGGKKKGLTILDRVKSKFDSVGCELNIIETKYAGHATDLARELDFTGYDGLVVVGGDGSVHETANGLMDRNSKSTIPLGIIPAGSGNSFARDIDLLDPLDAADAIIAANNNPFDVIEIEYENIKKYALNIIGWGLVTDIGIQAEKNRWLGPSRYTILSVVEVFKNFPRKASLLIDGTEIIDDFTFIIACNTIHTGKGMKMAPKAKIDDGLIDVVAVRYGASKIHLLNTLPKVFNGSHIGDRYIDYYQCKEFSLSTAKNEPLNIDGEMTGSAPIKGKVIKGALNIFR